MRHIWVGLAVACALWSTAGPELLAQSPSRAPHARAILRLADGHPRLQGVWFHGSLTPFERPVELRTKAFYTPEELEKIETQVAARRIAGRNASRPGDVGTDNEAFVDRGWISTHAGSGRLRGLPISEALHIVETYTMTGPDTIVFEMTVDDAAVYTRPWTVRLPLTRDSSYLIYETACHEGNDAIELVLRGARFEERQGRPAAGPAVTPAR